mmetsp:Transcript_152585/g.489314  ORF Transcript_152585/g.489314 Transcript_152585/m.489314 type:complete len:229 (-) Transcript_152585:218-904(-)
MQPAGRTRPGPLPGPASIGRSLAAASSSRVAAEGNNLACSRRQAVETNFAAAGTHSRTEWEVPDLGSLADLCAATGAASRSRPRHASGQLRTATTARRLSASWRGDRLERQPSCLGVLVPVTKATAAAACAGALASTTSTAAAAATATPRQRRAGRASRRRGGPSSRAAAAGLAEGPQARLSVCPRPSCAWVRSERSPWRYSPSRGRPKRSCDPCARWPPPPRCARGT